MEMKMKIEMVFEMVFLSGVLVNPFYCELRSQTLRQIISNLPAQHADC